MKSFLKELVITLLLCMVIALLLAVLLYDFNPTNKVVPNRVAYTIPENISAALEEEKGKNSAELQLEDKVYTIDGTDLNNYKKTNTYNPSKENPFSTSDYNNINTDGSINQNVVNNSSNSKINGTTTGTDPSKTVTRIK